MIARQNIASAEVRAAGLVATMERVPCLNVPLQAFAGVEPFGGVNLQAALASGSMLPVGTVEFVREAMRLANVTEPANLTYPDTPTARSMLQREVRLATAGQALSVAEPVFVKPARTKVFTGFVWDGAAEEAACTEHDREQRQVLRSLAHDEPVWISSPVHFVAEWRYYVLDGSVIGVGRYDPDGSDDEAEPDRNAIEVAAMKLAAELELHAFAMDVGRLADGRVALVEINDAWALGLYGNAVAAPDYVRMLWARWQQMSSVPSKG